MKKIMTIFGAILIASFIFSSCGGGKKKDKPTTDTTSSELNEPKEETQNKTSDVSNEAKVIAKKDTAKTDKIFFVVKNIDMPRVGMYDFLGEDKGKKKYIAVQIWVKNISNDEITLSQDDFKLFDQDDVEYIEKTEFADNRKEPIFFKTKGFDSFKIKSNEAKSGWITFITDIKSKAVKFTHENITVKF